MKYVTVDFIENKATKLDRIVIF